LEDRIVKNFFRKGTLEEVESDQVYGGKPDSQFHIITKKPILPSREEIKNNPRARTAKLRIAAKK
jgi:16S rRNA (cytosine1402-N4)-methyltransferase